MPNMDKRFSSAKTSKGRFTPLKGKDLNLMEKPLKKDFKWTPFRIVLFAIFFLVPYGSLIFVVSSLSPVLLSLMVGAPIVIGALFYVIHLLTKDV